MDENTGKLVSELIQTLATTWEGALVSAGITAGIFDAINFNISTTLENLSKRLKFDPVKLENWLYYMTQSGYICCEDNLYYLSDKGKLIATGSEVKELTGLLQLSEYYMNAAVHANETFRLHESLDKISDGKITRDYQPRVSDNFSAVLVEILNKYNVNPSDTLLDAGCGGGSFLRTIAVKIPEIKLTGMEANLFVVERGKKVNHDLGLSDRISLVVGDIIEDMEDIQDGAYDWVTAINIFHFVPEDKRLSLMENMIRIARKGVFATETIAEASTLSSTANVLMFMLWNDFTGFFRKKKLEEFNTTLAEKHKNCRFETLEIMHGKSNLLTIIKS